MAQRLILIALALSLGGCATMMSASSYCRIDKPIYISKQDKLSPGTARQILTENEKHKGICGE